MSNVAYQFFDDGTGCGTLPDGTVFWFDRICFEKIKDTNWYRNKRNGDPRSTYIINCNGDMLHSFLLECPPGYEIDHISLDTFDNRLCNLRICTHQQNQCNQPLQKNNTSGASGVSFYPPRRKYRARKKVCQHDIHLGYYLTFTGAVQARNIGMECMFGEYGRYNDVPKPPDWIRKRVVEKCRRFAELSICEAFFKEVAVDG